MSQIYRKANANDINHLQLINAAYKLAGVKTPTRGPAFSTMLNTIATPETVIQRRILDGLDNVTTDKQLHDWHKKTITALTESIAAERLRKEFTNQYQNVQRTRGTTYATQAVEDLAKPFADFIAEFSEAAKHLPEGKHALDPESCLAIDAGHHLKKTREALTQLGTYAGLIIARVSHGNAPAQLIGLANIVHFPEAKQEVIEGAAQATQNSAQLKNTMTIRKVDHDLRKLENDLTLVNIARGHYEGVTFQLADNTEYAARVENLNTAFTQKIHDPSPTGAQNRMRKAMGMTARW